MKYFMSVAHLLLCYCLLVGSTPLSAQLSVELDINNPLCGGFPTGKITANPSGGTPPYTYRWSTGAVSSFIEQLETGIYEVIVTDAANNFVVKYLPYFHWNSFIKLYSTGHFFISLKRE